MAGSRADTRERIDCQICSRTVSQQLPFCCTACARNTLYNARLKQAQMLLTKEALAREVERAVKGGEAIHEKHATSSNATPAARIAYDKARAERAEAKLATRCTEQHMQALEEELAAIRQEMAERKAKLVKRRQLLEAGESEMARQDLRREPVQLSIAKTETRDENLLKKTIHARTYVCQQTSLLYNLQRKKRRKGNEEKDIFYIFGLPVVDLQDLFNARTEPLNASLVNLVYLLNQVASYLSLRLPAELFLPSAEHAAPRILAPHSSYRQPSLLPPKQALDGSYHSNASASAHEFASSRPRFLRLDQPLTKLNAEDNVAYESFVEAVSLLAYDVAWLLKTQGMDVCKHSWEEACHIGRNLYLLLAPESEGRTRILKQVLGDEWQGDARNIKLGTFSHGTNRNFAAGVEGDVIGLKNWKLGNATQLIRKVKDVLMERKMGAEWEVLEEEAWVTPDDVHPRLPSDGNPQTDTDNEKVGSDRGSKGWMRIRSRNGEGSAG